MIQLLTLLMRGALVKTTAAGTLVHRLLAGMTGLSTASLLLVSALANAFNPSSGSAQTSAQLPSPATFSHIADPAARSKAMFSEIAKVLTSPRCMNCHPAGDHPLQGSDHHVHRPEVKRGPENNGVPGLVCGACHTEHNFTLTPGEASYQSIPGHQRWGLAPIEMAWEGKSIRDICLQIKDPARNGGRDLRLVQEHIAHDDLVGWAWHPGAGREPAPGSQEQLGDLVKAWIESGAECP